MSAAETDFSYFARRRLERLIKFCRVVVQSQMRGSAAVTSHFLETITLYADLLTGVMLTGEDSRGAERRVLGVLLQEAGTDASLLTKVEHLWATQPDDWANCTRQHELVSSKRGIIGWPSAKLQRWADWMSTRPFGEIDFVCGILSRGLTDSLLTSRVLEVPLRLLSFSHHRFSGDQVVLWQADMFSACRGASILLVDAHVESGRTMDACRRALHDLGISDVTLYATDSTLPSGQKLTTTQSFPIPEDFGRAFVTSPGLADARYPKSLSAPMIVICGYPASGKTFLRKALTSRLNVPAFSWSRTVRCLLSEFYGGPSLDAATQLTMAELRDPDLVAREFVFSSEASGADPQMPLIVDGMKTLSALKYLKRHLGRPAYVIHTYRTKEVTARAIRERGDFDDKWPDARIRLLQMIGLDNLISRADIKIDLSDIDPSDTSDSERTLSPSGDGRAIAELCSRLTERFAAANPHRIAAYVLLLTTDRRRLLLLKSSRSHAWGFPGGHVEKDEEPWEAAKRELDEETGIRVLELDISIEPFVLTKRLSQAKRALAEKRAYVFLATSGTEDVRLSSEHQEFRWVEFETAIEILPTSFAHIAEHVYRYCH